ncbi:unnamed protein product [Calypogeia fissa]
MGCRLEVTSCDKPNGSDEDGDADADDGQRIAETFSHYLVKSTGAKVTVRQLRSEGLSFQLWPAANATCLHIEKEYGEMGMSVIDVVNVANPPFQRCFADWYDSIPVLEGSKGHDDNRILDDCTVGPVDTFQRNGSQGTDLNVKGEALILQEVGRSLAGGDIGQQIDPVFANLVLDENMSSIDGNVSVCNGFELHGKHRTDSNGGLEAQILQGSEMPFASADIDNGMDPCFTKFEANHKQERNHRERNGAHIVDKLEAPLNLGTNSSNIDFPTRRLRVLELGSGTGMVGIVAACLGADVVLTDLPHVIANISYNLDLNRSVVAAAGGSVEARVLRWGVEEDVKALGEQSFDLILASDCVYYDNSYKPLLQTLNWLIALDTNHTSLAMQTRKPAILQEVSALLTPFREIELLRSQLLAPTVCLSTLSKVSMPVADATDTGVNVSEHAPQIKTGRRPVSKKPELSSETKEQSERSGGLGGNESVILLGHVRRWKKDSHFFRMAAKCFDVDVVYRHPPEENERIGPVVYRLTAKLNRKRSSTRSRSSSASSRSLPSCSPSLT